MSSFLTPRVLMTAFVFLVFILIASYVYFQSYDLIRGPVINIEEPKNGELSRESLVTIKGSARNITFITLNDSPIFTNKDGLFEEQLLLPNGYTIITLRAEDRFGRHIKKEINLTYQ